MKTVDNYNFQIEAFLAMYEFNVVRLFIKLRKFNFLLNVIFSQKCLLIVVFQ